MQLKMAASDPGLFLIMVLSLYVASSVVIEYPPGIGVLIGVPFLFVCPGYALASVLFRDRWPGSPAEALAYSVVLSLSAEAITGLILVSTPVGIDRVSYGFTLSTITFAAALLALIRRRKAKRDGEALIGRTEGQRTESRSAWKFACLGGMLLALPLAVLAITSPSVSSTNGDAFTEFYVVNSAGQLGKDGPEIGAGESFTARVYVTNHETTVSSYRIEATASDGERTAKDLVLGEGEAAITEMTFAFSEPSPSASVSFALYRNNEPSSYRTLRLHIRVVEH